MLQYILYRNIDSLFHLQIFWWILFWKQKRNKRGHKILWEASCQSYNWIGKCKWSMYKSINLYVEISIFWNKRKEGYFLRCSYFFCGLLTKQAKYLSQIIKLMFHHSKLSTLKFHVMFRVMEVISTLTKQFLERNGLFCSEAIVSLQSGWSSFLLSKPITVVQYLHPQVVQIIQIQKVRRACREMFKICNCMCRRS